MGLSISHGVWDSGYTTFHHWRKEIAKVINVPMDLMEGFYQPKGTNNPFNLQELKFEGEQEWMLYSIHEIKKCLPLKWSTLKYNPLHILLSHSDCDGYINYGACKKIADELEKIIDKLPANEFSGNRNDCKELTLRFIKGCREAYSKKQKLEFS